MENTSTIGRQLRHIVSLHAGKNTITVHVEQLKPYYLRARDSNADEVEETEESQMPHLQPEADLSFLDLRSSPITAQKSNETFPRRTGNCDPGDSFVASVKKATDGSVQASEMTKIEMHKCNSRPTQKMYF